MSTPELRSCGELRGFLGTRHTPRVNLRRSTTPLFCFRPSVHPPPAAFVLAWFLSLFFWSSVFALKSVDAVLPPPTRSRFGSSDVFVTVVDDCDECKSSASTRQFPDVCVINCGSPLGSSLLLNLTATGELQREIPPRDKEGFTRDFGLMFHEPRPASLL